MENEGSTRREIKEELWKEREMVGNAYLIDDAHKISNLKFPGTLKKPVIGVEILQPVLFTFLYNSATLLPINGHDVEKRSVELILICKEK
jgi:hypothetical protein